MYCVLCVLHSTNILSFASLPSYFYENISSPGHHIFSFKLPMNIFDEITNIHSRPPLTSILAPVMYLDLSMGEHYPLSRPSDHLHHPTCEMPRKLLSLLCLPDLQNHQAVDQLIFQPIYQTIMTWILPEFESMTT